MGYLQGANCHEGIRFPERLDDSMAEDTPGRVLEALVDALDLAACGCQRAVPAATGRPDDAPGALVKRYRYGSLARLRSSRHLEQETPHHVEWLWLLKKLRPDYKTLAHFRQRHREPLRQVCRTCTRLCTKLDLYGAALVAIDGRQCSAVHAQERNCTQDKRKKLSVQIDERVTADLQALAHRDDQEERGTGGSAHAAALEAKIEALTQRQRLDEGFQAHLLARGPAQLSRADPESRARTRGNGRGTEVCDHVQTAVDSQHT
jgi:transposase